MKEFRLYFPELNDNQWKMLEQKFLEVVGEDEKSKHVRRFQCPDDIYMWAEQWKMNSTPPYCSDCGKRMKSVEFDEEEGDDWVRNEVKDEIRTHIKELFEETK